MVTGMGITIITGIGTMATAVIPITGNAGR
jgi:hypothetical protein